MLIHFAAIFIVALPLFWLLGRYFHIKRQVFVTCDPTGKAYLHRLIIHLSDQTNLSFCFYSNYPHDDIDFFLMNADIVEFGHGKMVLHCGDGRTEINQRSILYTVLETSPLTISRTSPKNQQGDDHT